LLFEDYSEKKEKDDNTKGKDKEKSISEMEPKISRQSNAKKKDVPKEVGTDEGKGSEGVRKNGEKSKKVKELKDVSPLHRERKIRGE
jgi:hypothetical protein